MLRECDPDNVGLTLEQGGHFDRALLISGEAIRMWRNEPSLLPKILSIGFSHSSSRVNLRDILRSTPPTTTASVAAADNNVSSSGESDSSLSSTDEETTPQASDSLDASAPSNTVPSCASAPSKKRRGRPRRCTIDNGRVAVIVGRTFTKETYLIAAAIVNSETLENTKRILSTVAPHFPNLFAAGTGNHDVVCFSDRSDSISSALSAV
jgi:hypothetical protein